MTLAKRLWIRLWWMDKLLRAEQEPDPAKMRHPIDTISNLLDRKEISTCRICNKPLQLETDTHTDEDGKAVHEECYVKHVTTVTTSRVP
jgi:hypothetical protein